MEVCIFDNSLCTCVFKDVMNMKCSQTPFYFLNRHALNCELACTSHPFNFIYIFFPFSDAGDGTKGLMSMRQALSHTLIPDILLLHGSCTICVALLLRY